MYVYFIQAENGGPIKIGKSEYPDSRLRELQSYSPAKLVILGVCLGGRAGERALHMHFHNQRAHGEWFNPSLELETFIARLPSWVAVKEGKFCPELINSNEEVLFALHTQGFTYQQIGNLLNLSRQRVEQIVRPLRLSRRAPNPDGFRPRPKPAEPIERAYRRLRDQYEGIELSMPGQL